MKLNLLFLSFIFLSAVLYSVNFYIRIVHCNQLKRIFLVYSISQCKVVKPADVKKVATTLKRAIKVVGTPAYEEMVRNCMALDLSWKVRTHKIDPQIQSNEPY